MGQFSGIRQICIEQDFAAGLFIYNLQSLIEKQNQPYLETVSRERKHRYQVNKNVSFAILKEYTVRLFLEQFDLSCTISIFRKPPQYIRQVHTVKSIRYGYFQ